jgi:bifunctional non-homologous end joining protein LigD
LRDTRSATHRDSRELEPAAVFAFDLLQLRGKELRALPLLKRKAALQNELQRTERIVYCQHVGESGERLFQAAEKLGLERVIGKRADSPYRRDSARPAH